MKERAATVFPYVIAAALPLAGLVIALAWAVERRSYDAALAAAASLLGGVVWLIVLSG